MKNCFSLLLIACMFTAMAQEATDTNVDQSATGKNTELPSLVLKNTEGENVNFADYGTNGKITIISFWATWCKPCIRELKNMNELLEEWQENYGVELVAVSVDDSRNMTKVKPMVTGMGWDFDIILDPNGDLQRAMNVANPPVTFLVDQKGNIIYKHVGYVEGDEFHLEDEIIEISKP